LILVVDDDHEICHVLVEMLELDGHKVEIATSAGEAIAACRRRSFDLVFLDFYLPEMTGDKIVSILRRADPRQRIVIISGGKPYAEVKDADFFLRKPFEIESVRNVVDRFAKLGKEGDTAFLKLKKTA
jgi:CheY-like chemotaxis protein